MENPTRDESYAEAKRKAKAFYKTIGRVFCPALGNYVVFNSIGFQHLMRKRGKRRLENEQKRRFALLRDALCILTNPKVIIIHTTKIETHLQKWRGKKMNQVTRANFWALKEIKNHRTTTLLVRQLENGNKHFFSIY